jgi:hypothetical protein
MLHTADSVRKKLSEPLRVRTLQIIRFDVPFLEAWHRGSCSCPGQKGAVCGTVAPASMLAKYAGRCARVAEFGLKGDQGGAARRRHWPGVSARALPWEARPDARRAADRKHT